MTHEYVPASNAHVKVEKGGKAYTLNLGGHRIAVSKPDFVEQNQTLSALYVKETSQERRSAIAHRLYLLDLPLFKDWDLFGQESDREDYRQDAFLWTMMALENYDPVKGSFIHWLRYYIKKARDEARGFRNKGKITAEDEIKENEESHFQDPESALALERLRGLMSPERWEMLEMKVLKGMTSVEIAAQLKISRETARKRIDDAVAHLRVGMTLRTREDKDPILSDASEWLTRKQLAIRMGLSTWTVDCMMLPNIKRKYCRFKIDPRDISPISDGRIRYKERRDGGLEYPRLIERKKDNEA